MIMRSIKMDLTAMCHEDVDWIQSRVQLVTGYCEQGKMTLPFP